MAKSTTLSGTVSELLGTMIQKRHNMKTDNIPLTDTEVFQKPKPQVFVRTPKPLEGSKSIKLNKVQREQLKARRESLKELSEASHKMPLVHQPKARIDVISKLSKRGLMQYINQHSIEHLNPSETKKMSKEHLKEIAQKIHHIK